MRPSDRYTYENAGFNGFLNRSMKANPSAQTVAGGISRGSKTINFDFQQMVGALGDIIKIGSLKLDGQKGRISNENAEGADTWWLGDLTNG